MFFKVVEPQDYSCGSFFFVEFLNLNYMADNFNRYEEVLFPTTSKGDYQKGIITKFIRGTDKVRIEVPSTGEMYDCPKGILEKLQFNDINYRFDYYQDLCKLTIFKEIKSLLVAGEGGIGKTYVLNQLLESEEFVEDKDYVMVKGHVSPYALYNLLEENSTKPIIFDDCDGAMKDPQSANIIKAVIDTYSVRKVKWLTAIGAREKVSKSFEFKGSIIFLSNLDVARIPQPILSRTISVDLSMTPDEKVERMRHIVPFISELNMLEPKEKMDLVDMLDKYKLLVNDFNLRSLVKAGNIYAKTKSWDYVRTSILSS